MSDDEGTSLTSSGLFPSPPPQLMEGQQQYIGKRVAGRFTSGIYFGTIDNILDDKDDAIYFHVTYDDEDQADLELEECEEAMKLYEKYKDREAKYQKRGQAKFDDSKIILDGKCDVCNYPHGRQGFTLMQCLDCKVKVHKECYGIPKYLLQDIFLCWACRAKGKSIPASDSQGQPVGHIVPQNTPKQCDLCNYVEEDPEVVHAFHPIYDNYGPNARQLSINGRLVWGHSLCAFMLCTYGFLYGCSPEGEVHEGQRLDRFDDRTPNEYLRELQTEIEEDGSEIYGGAAPMHHFVFPIQRNELEVSNETKRIIHRIHQYQTQTQCFICTDTATKGEKEGEEKEWKDEDENEWNEDEDDKKVSATATATARSEDKDTAAMSRSNSKIGPFCIPMHCHAGDKIEFHKHRLTHRETLKDNETCTAALHVGCARWGKHSFHDSKYFHPRTFYWPGSDELLGKNEPVRCIYCNRHARDVTPAHVNKVNREEEETRQKIIKKRKKNMSRYDPTHKEEKVAAAPKLKKLKKRTDLEDISSDLIQHVGERNGKEERSMALKARKMHWKGVYKQKGKEFPYATWDQAKEELRAYILG